jgi:hypothetical protein
MSHFKLVKLANKLKPELIISRHHSYAAQNAMTHCPSIWLGDDCDIAGYPGTIRLGETILEKISNPYFFKRMARYPVHPYKKEWINDYALLSLSGFAGRRSRMRGVFTGIVFLHETEPGATA